jgi:hypothetical protein
MSFTYVHAKSSRFGQKPFYCTRNLELGRVNGQGNPFAVTSLLERQSASGRKYRFPYLPIHPPKVCHRHNRFYSKQCSAYLDARRSLF